MILFDNKGLLIIPSPKDPAAEREVQSVVIKKCFCINGHNLVSKQAQFGVYEGIVLNVIMDDKKGIIALSPVFGDKSRITTGIILDEGKLVQLFCPVCNAKLPVFSSCECGGDLLVMFTGALNDFNNCVGVCNRVGCKHAEIKNEGNMLTLTAPGMF
jgi:hypothetical protein